MAEYGEFWCDQCQAYYPDPLLELHRASHGERRRQLPDDVVVAVLAVLLIITFMVLNVRPI